MLRQLLDEGVSREVERERRPFVGLTRVRGGGSARDGCAGDAGGWYDSGAMGGEAIRWERER